MKYHLTAFLALLCFQLCFAQDTTRLPKYSEIEHSHPQIPKQSGFFIYSHNQKFKLNMGGYIKVVGVYELANGMEDHINFITYDIPVPKPEGLSNIFVLNAHQSRLYASMTGDVGFTYRLYLEAGFDGQDGKFIVRQAYGKLGNFLIGQTWSTIVDMGACPQTVDGEGPNTETIFRTAVVRYSHPVGKRISLAAALETPTVSPDLGKQIENPGQAFPDLIATIRYAGLKGHVQLGGVYRIIDYHDTLVGEKGKQNGYGISLSGVFHLTKYISFMSQGIYGQGIARYLQDISDRGLDLEIEINAIGNREISSIPAMGAFGALQIRWTPKLSSNLIYSRTHILEELPPEEYACGSYFSANVFWKLFPGVQFAVEYLHGVRENVNNQKASAGRLNIMAKFTF